MKRYLFDAIVGDLKKKMVFLTGPRQVGKTTLAESIMPLFTKPVYLNHDSIQDARIIQEQTWPPNADLLVFDEIHKMKQWKRFIKGVYDTRAPQQAILVTGSSRLDTFRQSGESLAGRYFHYRLNPLSVRELSGSYPARDALDRLIRFGGFPEPFFSGSDEEAARWRNQYHTDLIREDVLEFSRLHEIRAMRLLVELLRRRVGSPLSHASLAGDLQLAPNTVRKYVDILQALHVIFLVKPFHTNVARAILKEPKAYFYDSAHVLGDEGIRLENACAICLLKHAQFLRDRRGTNMELHCLRTKDGRETDFALSVDQALSAIIEVKVSDTTPAPGLRHFHKSFPDAESVQLVHRARHEEQRNGIRVIPACDWLAALDA